MRSTSRPSRLGRQRFGGSDTSREYPAHPIPGVAAIIVKKGKVLLTMRGNEPSKGKWGIPGGVVELGETMEEAVVREVREETGVDCRPVKRLTVFDSIRKDPDGRVHWHYILHEFLCEYIGGELLAGDDAGEAKWVPLNDLASVDIMDSTKKFLEKVTAEEHLS